MSVGEIATWVFLDGKGRALSKRGVVCGTSVFRTESVDGKQRKDFYVVSYNDEPCLEMVIFLYVMDGGGTGRKRTAEVGLTVLQFFSYNYYLIYFLMF